MQTKKYILITGGLGFIGSNFINYLLRKHPNYNIINIDCISYAANKKNIIKSKNYIFHKIDIRDKKKLNSLFEKYNITKIVHFAAQTHVDRSIVDDSEFVSTNVVGTHNLLWIANQKWKTKDQDKRFIHISTDEVYGFLKDGESGFEEKDSLNPTNPYSCSKAASDLLVKGYMTTHHFPAIIIRCSNNYGYYQSPEKLIPLTIYKLLNNLKVPVYGNGQQKRSWIFVEDTCKAIDLVLHHGKLKEIYNVGSEEEYPNLEVIYKIKKIIEELQNKPLNNDIIEFVEDRKAHDYRYFLKNEKMKKIDWNYEVCFQKGLLKTIKWYVENQNWLLQMKEKIEVKK